MVVGDKVRVRGTDALLVYVIKEVRVDFVVLEDPLTGKLTTQYNDRVLKTTLNPQLFITTYGHGWELNVTNLLSEAKIKYRIKTKDRTVPIVEYYVDARKMKKAKEVYEAYYKNLT